MIVCATTSLAYPKNYVFISRPIYKLYCYDIILPEFSMSFSMISWPVTITMSSDVTDVWQGNHDVTSNPNPKFKMKKKY